MTKPISSVRLVYLYEDAIRDRDLARSDWAQGLLDRTAVDTAQAAAEAARDALLDRIQALEEHALSFGLPFPG